ARRRSGQARGSPAAPRARRARPRRRPHLPCRRRAPRSGRARRRRRATAPPPSAARSRRRPERLRRIGLAELGLHHRQLVVDLTRLLRLRKLAVDVVALRGVVLERARRRELVDGGGACLQLLGLVLRALDRKPDVGHVLADSGRRLADLHLRLGRRVLGLDHFLLRPERLHLRLQRLLAVDQLLLLRVELLHLLAERIDLTLERRLPGERLAGEILAAVLERLPRLPVQLRRLLLQRRRLQLKPLLRGRDVRDA